MIKTTFREKPYLEGRGVVRLVIPVGSVLKAAIPSIITHVAPHS